MAKRARWAMLLALGVSAAAAPLAHCGGGDDDLSAKPSKPGTTTQHVCKSPKKLTVEKLHPSTDRAGVLEGTATGADSTTWTVRLELSDTDAAKMAAGKYDLSKENSSYDTCQHCVIAFQGDDYAGASKQLFQNSGTMQLTTVSSPPSAISKGALTNVLLREVKIDGASVDMTDVKNGGCYQIDTLEWDTLPAAGTKCQTAADCGDPSSVACDPADGTCKAFQCEIDTGKGCDATKQLCLGQGTEVSFGACYTRCSPFVPEEGCASGQECVSLDGDQGSGVCLPTGTAGEGQPCPLSNVSTGCAAGLACDPSDDSDDDQGVCRRVCDYFGDPTTCPDGQRCSYGGVCTAEPGDPAALGGTCATSSQEGTPCGSDATSWRGFCVAKDPIGDDDGDPDNDPDPVLLCQQPCRNGSSVYQDCEDGFTCGDSGSELGLTYCQPVATQQQETP